MICNGPSKKEKLLEQLKIKKTEVVVVFRGTENKKK